MTYFVALKGLLKIRAPPQHTSTTLKIERKNFKVSSKNRPTKEFHQSLSGSTRMTVQKVCTLNSFLGSYYRWAISAMSKLES